MRSIAGPERTAWVAQATMRDAPFARPCARALDAARVGRHDASRAVEVLLQVVLEEDGQRKEVVERDVEKSLDLPGVEVDAENAVDAGGHHEVGAELRGDWGAGRYLAVLPGIAVIGHHGGDRAGGRTAERVRHDEQLHQVVVHRRTGGLDDVRVDAADVFADLAECLAVAEPGNPALSERHLEDLRDLLSQRRIRVAREDAHLLEHDASEPLDDARFRSRPSPGKRAQS